MKKSNPKLKASILEVVSNQLKSGDPPETRQTFNRLIGEGISEKGAKIYIGQAVAIEIFNVMKHGETFNLVRYCNNLSPLTDEILD
ncbi:MAG: hypothetical protein ABSE95_02590 [Thermodesulfobacteriota bacterium]|jgi:predicted nucleic-acid-binding protein